jgi:protein transport protein SEC13
MTLLETEHQDLIHDAQMDYYGRKLATCSSDKTIKLFSINGNEQKPLDTLIG